MGCWWNSSDGDFLKCLIVNLLLEIATWSMALELIIVDFIVYILYIYVVEGREKKEGMRKNWTLKNYMKDGPT